MITFKMKFKKLNRRSKIMWKSCRGGRKCRNNIKAVQVTTGDRNDKDMEKNKKDFPLPKKSYIDSNAMVSDLNFYIFAVTDCKWSTVQAFMCKFL